MITLFLLFYRRVEVQKKQEKITTPKPEIKIAKRNPNPFEKDPTTPKPEIKIAKRNPNPFEKDPNKKKQTPKTDQKLPRRNIIDPGSEEKEKVSDKKKETPKPAKKIERNYETKPFAQLMSGVVFTISGNAREFRGFL